MSRARSARMRSPESQSVADKLLAKADCLRLDLGIYRQPGQPPVVEGTIEVGALVLDASDLADVAALLAAFARKDGAE